MLKSVYSSRFLKDYKLMQKRGFPMKALIRIMKDLESEIPLQPHHNKHPLHGKYRGCLECHVAPNWLLIYKLDEKLREIYFVRTGSHSDLF